MNKQDEDTSKNTTNAKPICKLGLDCHAASIMVVRQDEGLNPQPPQRFTVVKFLAWVAALIQQGYQVCSCYEAGPTGYWLHRKLEQLGVINRVIARPVWTAAARV